MKARKWDRIHRIEDLGEFVEVRVSFYRDIDRKRLKKRLPEIDALVPANGSILRIPRSEFLTYWLFESKNPDDPLLKDFKSLSKRAADAIPDLRSDFERSEDDIRALPKKIGTERASDIPTRLGVAAGLGVANQLLGLTEADWSKIDTSYNQKGKQIPRLDYELGATQKGYVAVENKGAINTNNSKKTASISNLKRDILKKKKATRKHPGKSAKECTMFGTIAVADSRNDSKLRCWLVDPPFDLPNDTRPNVYRACNRISFLGGLLRMIFPVWRSLHRAIDERTDAIREANALEPFDQNPLKKTNGDEFDFKWDAGRKPQAQTSWGLTVGIIGPCGHDHLLFIGIQQRMVKMVVSQDLDQLSTATGQSLSIKTTLRWKPTSKELALLNCVDTEMQAQDFVEVPAIVHHTRSGFAFALIPMKPIRSNKNYAQ